MQYPVKIKNIYFRSRLWIVLDSTEGIVPQTHKNTEIGGNNEVDG